MTHLVRHSLFMHKTGCNDTDEPFEVSNRNVFLMPEVVQLSPDFTSKLVHVLAFGTPKFYIAPYDKIKHELFNLSSNCGVKSGLRL